jgi:hypothetical protein
MPVEPLDLRKEPHIQPMTVQDTDRVVGIGGGNEPVSRVGDRLEMAGRHKSGDSDDREIPAQDRISPLVLTGPKCNFQQVAVSTWPDRFGHG